MVLADVTERDADGELIAVPTEWDTDAHGEAPRIRLHVPRKARPAEIPGVGDRVLTRTEETGEDGDAIRHTGRVIKVLDRARQRQIGVFRALAERRRAARPGDKREAGREIDIPPRRHDGRAGWRPGRGRVDRARAASACRPRA